MKLLEDTLSAIQSAETQEDAFSRFNDAMLDFGYDSNIYTLLTDHPSMGLKAKHGLIASYPMEWLSYYNAQQFQQIDPVWERLLHSPTPFFWADVLARIKEGSSLAEEKTKAALRVMQEGAEAGVADGIGISFVNAHGEMAAIGLSRKRGEKERRYEDMAAVFLIASFFHEKFRGFLEKPKAHILTPREREVLLWASEGRTDAEIAAILCISTPTIRFHWKNLSQKLEVNGRLLAVIKAIHLKLITPQSIRSPYQN